MFNVFFHKYIKKNFKNKKISFIFKKKHINMDILLTNHTLSSIGGSETFTYAMAIELNKRSNINLEVFSPKLGIVSDKLKSSGIKVINSLNRDYDYIMASHTATINFMNNVKGFKIQTCHGIYVSGENIDNRVNGYVSISEEVYNSLKNNRLNSTIITNGVDCDRFSPKKDINKEVKSILSLSQSAQFNSTLRNVTNRMGIKLVEFNKFKNPIFDIENVINDVDLVVSLGRGVYESMACGRNVLILDKRPYIPGNPIGDGLVMGDIDDFIKNNCSGRYSKKMFTDKQLEEEIRKYEYSYGEMNREYAIKNLNIKDKADQYIKLYENNRVN